jgi:transposase
MHNLPAYCMGKTVAMESTGTYWQHLYITLQAAGFKVILCNGKFTKNIKGRKTDVMDAQWIQKLHTIGMLTGSFLPDEATEKKTQIKTTVDST